MSDIDEEMEKEVEAVLKKAMALMTRVHEVTAESPDDPSSTQLKRAADSMVTNLGQALAIARERDRSGET
jgi:hypothetical protein